MNTNLFSSTIEETLTIAKKLAKDLNGKELILLYGDLGAGKTVFVKGIAEYFGIDKSEIVSPTFTILNEYDSERIKIYHFDLYRIGNSIGKYFYEIDELLEQGLILVEWADYLSEYYKKRINTINIYFELLDNFKRRIKISKNLIDTNN